MDTNFKEKQEAFIKEYGDLVTKHNMDFAYYPAYVPLPDGGFKTIIQTTPIAVNPESHDQFIQKEEPTGDKN